MKKDPTIFINHILECIERIQDYTAGVSQDKFLSSPQIQDAVMRRIEVIGEAVKKLNPEVKDKHPEIPWKRVAGMRDTLIHDYFGVDLKLTWKVATEDIAELKRNISAVRNDLGKD